MHAVVALRHTKVEGHGDFSVETNNDFPDFPDEKLLGSIDFDDTFLDMDHYGNDLPDFEMDSVLLTDFSISSTDDDESDPNIWVPVGLVEDRMDKSNEEDEEDKVLGSSSSQGENSFTKKDKNAVTKLSTRDGQVKGRSKSSSQGKNSLAKRKVKKYRSHRKHLLAREAEAASWCQRQKMNCMQYSRWRGWEERTEPVGCTKYGIYSSPGHATSTASDTHAPF